MELIEPAADQYAVGTGIPCDAATFVLSRFPHADTADACSAAFVDATTGRTLSFSELRRGALSLAAGLRLGLGLQRGDAVLILSPNSLLVPPIVIGALAAGGVVVTADPDAPAAEIATMVRRSRVEIVIATPEVACKVAGVGAPVLLTSQSPEAEAPLSVEELMNGSDPTALVATEVARERPGPSDVAAVVYSSAGKEVVLTHEDLITAIAQMTNASSLEMPDVCLGLLPVWDVHGLALLALGTPAARATTVIMSQFDAEAAREVVKTRGVTMVAATPAEVAAVAAGMVQGWDLSRLRSVMAAPPLPTAARREFRRRLPWVELIELHDTPEKQMEATIEQIQTAPAELGNLQHTKPEAVDAAMTRQEGDKTRQVPMTREALVKFIADQVVPYKKIKKTSFGDAISKSSACKLMRKHLAPQNRHIVSKL